MAVFLIADKKIDSAIVFVPIDNANQSDQFSDWKTYSNSEYGVEFKYPKELAMKEYNDYASADRFYKAVRLLGSNLDYI